MDWDPTREMRPSRVLRKLRAGEVVSSFKLNLSCPRIVEVAAAAGFDCLWTCMEHVPNSFSVIEEQIRAAKIYDTDIVVRVMRGSYSDYIRPLEMDAAGIMVPHVMSLEDAKRVVWMTRFHPVGRRPVDGGNADGGYCRTPTLDYFRQANEQRFVMVQIEDPEPMDDLEEIAKLDGIDIIFFGPADFSQGIGAPCEWNNPKLIDAKKRVAEVSIKNGKFAGTTGSLENLDELVEMGYRIVNIGSDVRTLAVQTDLLIEGFNKRRSAI